MYISQYIIYILAVHHYLAAPRLGEQLRQCIACSGLDIHRHHLIAREHTVTHMCIGEIKGVMEYLHLILHRSLGRVHLINRLFKILVKVTHRKHPYALRTGTDTAQPHQCLRQPRRKQRHRIKHNIEHSYRQCKYLQRCIGIDSEHCLGEKFSGYQNHAGGYQGRQHKYQRLIQMVLVKPIVLYQISRSHTVDHKHYIITHQYGGYEQILVGIEARYYTSQESTSLHIQFHAHAVGGYIGYLSTGE